MDPTAPEGAMSVEGETSPWAKSSPPRAPAPDARAPRRRSRWLRRAGKGLVVAGAGVGALWYAIHEIPGFGPALVDGVRGVVGPGPIAWIEDVAYGVADRVNQLRYGSAPPKTFWAAAPATAPQGATGAPAAAAGPAAEAAERVEPPPGFEPPYKIVAAPGDGVWIPMPDTAAPGAAPVLWKSVVHPDARRGFAAVAVVAIDLARAEVRLVAGTSEPASQKVPEERRPGLVPAGQAADLVAAFNGGFKAMHGNYGMMLGGETYIPPRDMACTIAFRGDGGVRIRTWTALKDQHAAGELAAYRQTPPCLVEQGELNVGLSESNRNWGATVSGETIIRRSALGVDAEGRFLFYGLGEAVSSQAIARAMKAAGARDAAQLDVNHAYPRFLMYARGTAGAPPYAESSLIPDVSFKPTEYVTDPSPRDFFYIARRDPLK